MLDETTNAVEMTASEVEVATNEVANEVTNEVTNEVAESASKPINSEFKLGQTLSLKDNGGKLVIVSVERANGSGQVLYTAEINGTLSVYTQNTRSNQKGDVRKYRATEIKVLCGMELNERASNGESKTRKEYEKVDDSLIIRPLKREFISKVRENVIVNIHCAENTIEDNENKIAHLKEQNERLSAQIKDAENWLNSTTAEDYEREQNAIFDEIEAEAEANKKETIAKRNAEKALDNVSESMAVDMLKAKVSAKEMLKANIEMFKAMGESDDIIKAMEDKLAKME